MSAERRATYRLQLGAGLGFAQAGALAGYLARLGVSHVYLSPCLQARSGSTHGYDVVDFGRASDALGGEEDFARMCEAFREHGLGVLLDIVPNHMAIGSENSWWWDVLENGPSSRFAGHFDIEWSHALAEGGLLLPVLGDHYGRVLERNELRVERDGARFRVRCGEHAFPAAPRSLPEILAPAAERCGSAPLAYLARALEALPLPTATERESVERRHRDKAALGELLDRLLAEDASAAKAVDEELARLAADLERFDAFLSRQNYRLAFWRIASRELDYRRFFDVDALVALRVEDPGVFAETHGHVLEWLRSGRISGFRVDHIDGLRDPEAYLRRLEAHGDAWVVVEKILEPGEELPGSWPVDGTTGYEFLELAGGLFVDPQAEEPLTRFYESFSGESADPAAVLVEAKREVLDRLLGSDLRRLGELLAAVCRRHRRHRDYTDRELEAALRALLAHFPVYRTYVRPGPGGVSEADVARVGEAVGAAKRERRDVSPDLLDFVGDVLLLRVPGAAETELALRFQQLSGPAMAKGAEDTAFYRFARMIALNEVGGNPARFGTPPEAFHAFCARRPARSRGGLLASSTHDTKRSEDVRARLALLSEIPIEWIAAVRRWSSLAAPHRSPAVDPNTEYMLYQLLFGAWPIDAERAWPCLLKCAREAKRQTSWRAPDPLYEQALRALVEGLLGDAGFRSDLEAFLAPLIPAAQVNSLALTLIKLSAPGVPDLYNGTELWDLSLMDPDNRRAVDFGLRAALLDEIAAAPPEAVLARADEGLPKLWLIQRVLALRRERPEVLAPRASYAPLEVRGARSANVLAFTRAGCCASVAPRLTRGLGGDWGDTRVELPAGRWRDALADEPLGDGAPRLAALFARFPVAFLVREDGVR